MSKDKQQIEEMAKEICTSRSACFVKADESCRKCYLHKSCLYQDIAYALYRVGYRKQSENTIELPCKGGDTVYAISESRIEECRCDEIFIYGNDNIVMTEHNCDYDCKGCPFSSWGQDYSGEHSCQGEYGVYSFNFEDFGKIVFLTKEEAEKALAKMKGGE